MDLELIIRKGLMRRAWVRIENSKSLYFFNFIKNIKLLKIYNGTVAQMVEHRAEDAGVVGSLPTSTTKYKSTKHMAMVYVVFGYPCAYDENH